MSSMADGVKGPPDERALLFYLMGIFAASAELDGLSNADCKALCDALEARLEPQSSSSGDPK